jgi:hypothetical protein
MRHRMMIGAWVVAGVLVAPVLALAQLPGGMQMPGGTSLPMGGFSKDTLLNQAKAMVTDLTAMKSSDKLAPAQVSQVDNLLPKATSLTSELEKPQVDAARLPKLATDLSDLQKQVGALKDLMK